MANSDLIGKQVLIVEDHAETAKMLVEILESEGCHGQVASTGAEAFNLLAMWAGGPGSLPDAILLDLGLPDMNGGEVVRQLQAVNWNLPPIVVVSAWPAEKAGKEARSIGSNTVPNRR